MGRRTFDMSFRTVLIIAFFSLMAFPMIILTIVTYQKQNEISQKQVSEFLMQTVEQAHHALDANLSEIDRLTWPLLYQDEIDFTDTDKSQPFSVIQAAQKFKSEVFLNLLRGRMNQIRSVYFITSNGVLLSSDNSYDSSEIHSGNLAYINGQLEQNPLKMKWFHPSKAIVDSKDGFETSIQSSVIAARKIFDSNHVKLQGTLFIHFNNRFLQDELQTVKIGKSGALLLLDSESNLIFQQDSPIFDNPNLLNIIKVYTAGAGSQSGSRVLDGKWLTALEVSPISGWRMAAVVPISELLEPNRLILRNLLVFAALGACVSVLVSILLATAIAKPIVRLSRLMSKASIGNLEVRSTQETFQEITVLQQSFNRLMEQIQRLMQEIEQEHKEKQEAKMKALQTQIHPHFLYNTLDTMYWMSKRYKAEALSRLVTALGRFFRLSLSASADFTALQREFEHVANYLEIQSFRYKDRICSRIELAEDIRHAAVPPLILQPIVENALEYGTDPNRPDPMEISVIGRREKDCAVIEIRDDGKGMEADVLHKVLLSLQEPSGGAEHIGLRNVQQRLVMAFGPEYGLQLDSVQGVGTTVTIRIPIKEMKEEA